MQFTFHQTLVHLVAQIKAYPEFSNYIKMKKYLISLAGCILFLVSESFTQDLSLSIAYLNAQTASLEKIQRHLAYQNLLKVGLASQVPSTPTVNYSERYSTQTLYKKLQRSFSQSPRPELEELKTLVERSEYLYQNIKKVSQKDALSAKDFQKAGLLFEDIHILNRKIDHELQEKADTYANALRERNERLPTDALALARKLVVAYRYELKTDITKFSRQLASLPFIAVNPSHRFSKDFSQVLLARIKKEETYNNKVLPAFNLWVDTYNEWVEKLSPDQHAQLKLGPEFIPIQQSEINSPKIAAVPQNLIFLLDISGSMRKAEKLPLIKKSLLEILPHLNKDDRIDILCFAENSQQIISNYSPVHVDQIAQALDKVQADGNTQPFSSFESAYRIAKNNQETERQTQIIFLTDGGFEIDPDKLPALIEQQRYEGLGLSIIYSGNHESSVRNRLRKLAEIGNGHYLALGNTNSAQHLLQVIQSKNFP